MTTAASTSYSARTSSEAIYASIFSGDSPTKIQQIFLSTAEKIKTDGDLRITLDQCRSAVLETFKQKIEENHLCLAISLDLHLQLQYERAMKFVCRMGMKNPSEEEHPVMSFALVISADMRLDHRGLSVCKQVHDIQKKIFGADHPETANTLRAMGFLSSFLKRYAEAETCYQRALEIFHTCPEEDLEVAKTLLLMGLSLFFSRRRSEALMCYQKASETLREYPSETTSSLVTTLNHMGTVLRKLRRSDEALVCYLEIYKIQKEQFGEGSQSLRAILNDLGDVSKDLGKNKEAQEWYETLLQMEKESSGEKGPMVAQILSDIGDVLRNSGRLEEALEHYRESHKIFCNNFGKFNNNTEDQEIKICSTLNKLGRVAIELGSNAEALKWYLELLEVQSDYYPRGDLYREAQTLKNTGDVLNNLGRLEEALKHYREASKNISQCRIRDDNKFAEELRGKIRTLEASQEKSMTGLR